MPIVSPLIVVVLGWLLPFGVVQTAPRADIANGSVHATLLLPDAVSGYYRGTRFDWAGAIASLEWNHHSYFGQWFDVYNPTTHDAIMGPVEEFVSGIGYDEAKVGDAFLRIGVGAVRKPQEPAYQQFHTYEIVNPGAWTIERGPDRISFVHEISDTNGYAYVYRKTLTLEADGLVIGHQLRNTGRKTIATAVYEHNFFMLDQQPTGPDVTVQFPFEATARAPMNGLAEIRGDRLVYLKELQRGETAFTEITGFGPTASDYDIRVENHRTGAGVRQTADRPMSKLMFWSPRSTVCPEAYVDVRAEPGQETSWRISYEFYTVR